MSQIQDQQLEYALQKVDSCALLVKNVFLRYGIRFNLAFSPTRSSRNPSFDHTVDLYVGNGLSSSNMWFLFGIEGNSDSRFCITMTHEIGHLLGLHDEYEDNDCPDREFVSKERNPSSIMGGHSFSMDTLDFYPRHIAQIIQPICQTTSLDTEIHTRD